MVSKTDTTSKSRLHRTGANARVAVTTTSRKVAEPALRRAVVTPGEAPPADPPPTATPPRP